MFDSFPETLIPLHPFKEIGLVECLLEVPNNLIFIHDRPNCVQLFLDDHLLFYSFWGAIVVAFNY